MGVLYRLIGFAKSSQWLALLGFLLMVASTSADLVPTYLTMPLVDKVLVPAYEHRGIGGSWTVAWYLFGFAGRHADLAIGVGRTYVLALVSERIAVDLRNRTYQHMQRLSVEFFGRERTGDLIADQYRHRSDSATSSRSTCSTSATTC